jgi:hypothetical protein
MDICLLAGENKPAKIMAVIFAKITEMKGTERIDVTLPEICE